MTEQAQAQISDGDMLRMAADIVAAYVSRNTLPQNRVAELINIIYGALRGLDGVSGGSGMNARKPAVAVNRSITPDYLVCLEDGKKLKMLKRYLRTTYGLSPQEYRAKWRLPIDYPMVAPNYAKQRSEFAKKIGLGHKRRK